MKKTLKFLLILLVFQSALTQANSTILNCKFQEIAIEGIKSIEFLNEDLLINHDFKIPLEKSKINCGNFGKQLRFDGTYQGLQIILESCSSEAKLEGHLIDSVGEMAAAVRCFQMEDPELSRHTDQN